MFLQKGYETLEMYWFRSEHAKETFLFGFFVVILFQILEIGGLVSLGFGNGNGLLAGTSDSTRSGPIQPRALTKNTDRLLLKIAAIGIVLIRFQPLHFLRATDIRIILERKRFGECGSIT